jgi:PKD repeat protein
MKKIITILTLSFVIFSAYSQIPKYGLVAWYKFNGNAGDSSGYGNHGTVSNATLTTDRFGNANSAYYFNGSSSYILAPASASIQPKNSISIGVWINAESNGNQWTPILSKRNNYTSYPYDSYSFSRHPTNNSGKWSIGINGSTNIVGLYATQPPNLNNWQYLLATYDGQIVKLYVDGIFVASSAFSDSLIYSNLGLYIGNNSLGGQYFKGKIDDITIHNRALNDNEIANLYSPIKNNTISGSQVLCAGTTSTVLIGSMPNGGMDSLNYSYSWIQSNTSDSSGFFIANGNSFVQNFPLVNINNTTWFRRIVQAGNSIDTSNAIKITVKPKPAIYIGVNNSNQCITSNSFSFTDNTSYNGSFTRLWNLGSGTIDTTRVINPTKSYGSAGTYYVSYLAIADNGCRDSTILTVNVGTMPSVGFNVNNYVQCAGNAFNFSDTSKASSGSLTRLWNFGGGQNDISTQIYPTKNYVNGGTYNVKLVVNNYGCIDSASKTITVLAKPNAGFTMGNAIQCVTNNSFSFADTTTQVNVSRKWFFGNGDTSIIANPNIIYGQPNNYTVKLVLSNINGCKDSASKNITISAKPNPGFMISNPSQCVNGNSFVMYDTSKVALGLLNRVWYLGDGGTSTASPVSKSYINAGNYNIKLVVSNPGCRDSITQTISVNPKPMAGFTLNNATQCYKDQLFTLSDTSAISTGTYTRTWFMGDATLTSSNPVYKSYNNPGNYTIKLVLNSDKGCKDSVSKSVTVNASPNAGFTINNASQCLNNNSFSFLDTSNISAGSISRIWYYDNTQSTATTNPLVRNYTSSSSYTIKLVISSNKGCKDSVSRNITVNPLPNVSISTSNQKDNVCNGSSIALTGNGAVSYSWDNGISNGVSFTPVSTRSYTVTGSDQNGCLNSASKTIKLNSLPIVTINASASAVCAGSSLTLTGVGALNYAWNGGVVNGLAFNPSATNTYTVTGTDSNSCSSSASKTITVNPLPIVVANASADPICAGSSTTLFGSGATTYSWSGGVVNNVPFTPSATGTYTVTGIDANNCSNTASKTISVNPLPNITVSINGWTISSNETGAALYQWINCSNNQAIGGAINKTYTATANGSYAVIVSKNNCLDTSACTTFSNVGMDEYLSKKASLSVFPNPNSGSFAITSDVDGDFIITNELGQNVMNISLNKNNKFTQTITNIDNGIYFIIGINSYKKIVVNK